MKYASFLTADCVNEIDAQRVFGYALFKDGKNTRRSEERRVGKEC